MYKSKYSFTILIACSLFFLGACYAQNPTTQDTAKVNNVAPPAAYNFPSAKKRLGRYLNDSFGVNALVGIAIGATFQQIDNQPPEWKKTANGFARRLGSNYGQNAIEQSTLYGLSEVFRQDQKYQDCDCTGVFARAGHSIKSGFTAKNRSGKTVFSPPKIVSPFVSNIAAVKLWYPKRYSVSDGLRTGAYGLLFNTGFNLIQEFIFKKK